MIQARNFSKRYGEFAAVTDLSFDVLPGQIMGLLGPNGAGKTTTMKAMCGILAPTAGQLFVAGYDVVAQPVNAKRLLAYVPDDPHLFEALTVLEHLEFSAKAYGVRDWGPKAEALLSRLELLEKKDALASELSRGMRQKVAIACAYLHDPRAIFLDEPLTGLDPRGIRTMKDALRERAAAGAAVVVSSHLLALVEDLCTHLLILHKGRLVFAGGVTEARTAFATAADATLEEVFFNATEGLPPATSPPPLQPTPPRGTPMNALAFLLRMHMVAFVRRLARKARGVKGIIMTVIGGLLFVTWLGASLTPMLMRQGKIPADVDAVRQTFPVVMLVLAVLSLVGSAGGKGIVFSAPEVDFLFPGPFSRRKLLLYRIARTGLASLFGAIFFGMGLRQFSVSWAGTYAACVLLLLFMQIYAIAGAMLFQSISERLSLWRFRAAVIAAAGVLVLVALYFAPLPTLPDVAGAPVSSTTQPAALAAALAPLIQLRDSPLVQILALPFKPFAYALTAATWPALAGWSALSLVVVALTLAFTLYLDADYLESSAANSARLHQTLTDARRGKVALRVSKTSRLRLPALPRCGGAGAIAWRQGTTALRSMKGVLLLAVLGCLGLAPLLMIKGVKDTTAPLVMLLCFFTFLGGSMFRFDFRGDMDRLVELKGLPIGALALSAGQLATPVALMCFFQWLVLGVITLVKPESWQLIVAAAAFAPLLSLTFTAVENAAFLLFPTRAATSPGDLTAVARGALMLLAKVALLSAAAASAFAVGWVTYYLTDSLPAGLTLAWIVAAGITLATLPAVAWTFNRYDVADGLADAA